MSRLSFELRAPVTFLVGENGSGKTTTLRVALGALRPSAGSVRLARGADVSRVGYCPQDFRLPTHVRAQEYLAYLSRLRGIERSAIADAVERRDRRGGTRRSPGRSQAHPGAGEHSDGEPWGGRVPHDDDGPSGCRRAQRDRDDERGEHL